MTLIDSKQAMTKILRFMAFAGITFSIAETMAFADSFTYQAAGSNLFYSVSAVATLVTSSNSVSVQLSNTVMNPTAIDQNLSAIVFQLSTPVTMNSGSIVSTSVVERTVASNGSFTDVSDMTPTWSLNDSSTGLVALGVMGTTQTIIGSAADSRYTNANASIAGNASNNPFLAGPSTFVISLPELAANTQVESANFFFGPSSSPVIIPGTLVSTPTPEPSSFMLFGAGLFAIAGILIRSALAAVRQA